MSALKLQLILITMSLSYVLAGEVIQTAKGIKYYIDNQYRFTWYDAFLECSLRNMSLYTIASQAQFEDLAEFLLSGKYQNQKPPHLWIGAVGVNKRFVWVKTRQPVITSLWADGNPDYSLQKENCVHIWENKRYLNDGECIAKIGFVCEFVQDPVEVKYEKPVGNNTVVNEGKFKGLTLNIIQRN